MSDTLNKLWDSLSPIPAEAPSEPVEAMEKPVLERLWDKLTKPATGTSKGRSGGMPSSVDSIFEKLIMAESGGRHIDEKGRLVTSPVGAEGITQLMPETAKKPGFGIEPVKDKSEGEYRRVGKQYLEALVSEFKGDQEKALAAYNAGISNVRKAVQKGGVNWKDFLPRKEETLPYLERILRK